MVVSQDYDDNSFVGVRLPTYCKPYRYDLTIEPDFKVLTFMGHVSIDVTITESNMDRIVLHALDINFTDVSYVPYDAETYSIKQVTLSKKSETASLVFDKQLKKGSGKLHITFNGPLNDKMKGFYRGTYSGSNGEQRYLAVTKFEPTYARYALPCWDEPAIKAQFDVTLIVDSDRVALSNMDVKEESTNTDGKKVVKFNTSPVMSTYLLAFIVGEFDHVEGFSKTRPVRVYTPLEKSQQGLYALEVAIKSLDFFEQYFEIDYPLTKLDLIAIPDFSSGAMENWGLITYRETALLADPQNTSTITRQNIALYVTHEIAHQWFGNLVTMEWWTHLWLNEGFATFMEFLCTDHIFPQYDIWTQFAIDNHAVALDLDALHSSHPIEVPVNHPSELNEIFDAISYQKGASIIKMLHNYVSDKCFREGLKAYLTQFAYNNTSTEHLWLALEAASGLPVCEVMSQWTKQKGFPWLSVCTKVNDNEEKSITLTIEQKKFASNGQITLEESNLLWHIPIAVTTGSNPTKIAKQFLLSKSSDELKLFDVGENWIKLNSNTVGFYRTAYPEEMIEKLIPAIASKTLPPMDRFNILDDIFALCQAGNVSSVTLFKIISALRDEDDFTVWSTIDKCLGRLNILLSYTDFQSLFHTFGLKLYNAILDKLTWFSSPGEKHTDTLTRTLVLSRLVSFGDTAALEEGRRRFKAHLNNTSMISADLRTAVYKAAACGDDNLFDSLFDIYRRTDMQEEKNRVTVALGSVQDEARIARVLDFAMSNEVRDQDKFRVIIYVSMTRPGRELVWDFIKARSAEIRKLYENSSLLAILLKNTLQNFASEEKALEIAKYFEENKFPGTERNVQQSIETILLNANWLKRDSASIEAFLSISS